MAAVIPSPFVVHVRTVPAAAMEQQRRLLLEREPNLEKIIHSSERMIGLLVEVIRMDRIIHGCGQKTISCCRLPTSQILTEIGQMRNQSQDKITLCGNIVLAALQCSENLNISFPILDIESPMGTEKASRLLKEIRNYLLTAKMILPGPLIHSTTLTSSDLISRLGGTPEPDKSKCHLRIVSNSFSKQPNSVRIISSRKTAQGGVLYLCHFLYYPNSYNSWVKEEFLESYPGHPYVRKQKRKNEIVSVSETFLDDSIHFNELCAAEDYTVDAMDVGSDEFIARIKNTEISQPKSSIEREKRQREPNTISEQQIKRQLEAKPPPSRRRQPSRDVPEWFSTAAIHDIERHEFLSSDGLTPDAYKEIRNLIIQAWEMQPTKYYEVSSAVSSIHHPIENVVRVHSFLEQYQIINKDTQAMSPATPVLFVDTPYGLLPSVTPSTPDCDGILYPGAKPFTKMEELLILQLVAEYRQKDGRPNWEEIGQRINRPAHDCLQWFINTNLDDIEIDAPRKKTVEGEVGEDQSFLSPFADVRNRVMVTMAFLANIAPPEDTKTAADAALKSLVASVSSDGKIKAQDETSATEAAVRIFSSRARDLAKVEEDNIRRLSRIAVSKLLQQTLLSIEASDRIEQQLSSSRRQLQQERTKLDREEADLRQRVLARRKKLDPTTPTERVGLHTNNQMNIINPHSMPSGGLDVANLEDLDGFSEIHQTPTPKG